MERKKGGEAEKARRGRGGRGEGGEAEKARRGRGKGGSSIPQSLQTDIVTS